MQSGKKIEFISEKIAELRVQVDQYGKLGLLNVNNYCEGFVMRLLNIIFDYQMRNLNHLQMNFPGLDIGSESDGIAFQITSDKTSGKVNETLSTVLKFKHYAKFQKIKIFMLTGKQNKYSISIDTNHHFLFNSDADILDFDDILKEIKNCTIERLSDIFNFVSMEFPEVLSNLKTNLTNPIPSTTLLNVEAGQIKCNLKYFNHSILKIRMYGGNFSTQDIYRQMNKHFVNAQTKSFLELFNPAYQTTTTASNVRFHKNLTMDGASNVVKEGLLDIQNSNITYERVEYNSNSLMITSLVHEIKSLISLIFLCKSLFKNKQVQLEIHLELATNGELHFNQQYSLYRTTNHPIASYVLNPKSFSFAKMIHDSNNETVVEIMQELLDNFVAKSDYFSTVQPFMEVDVIEQSKVIDSLKNMFFPSEF